VTAGGVCRNDSQYPSGLAVAAFAFVLWENGNELVETGVSSVSKVGWRERGDGSEEKSVVVGDGEMFRTNKGDLGSGLFRRGWLSRAFWKACVALWAASKFPRLRCGGVGF
jgi:hypothetical protein